MCIVFTATFGTIWKDPSTTSDVNREENLIKLLKKILILPKKKSNREFLAFFRQHQKEGKVFGSVEKFFGKNPNEKKKLTS